MAKLCALPRQSSTQTDLDHVCCLLLFIFRLFVDQLWVAGCHSRRQKEKRASNQTALDPPKKTRTEHKTKQQRQLEDDALPVHDVGQKVVVLQPVIDVDFVVVDGQRSRSDASFLNPIVSINQKSVYFFSIFYFQSKKKRERGWKGLEMTKSVGGLVQKRK